MSQSPDHPLEIQFAYYTECQAATVAILKERNRFPKHEIERQERILAGMVEVCRRHNIHPQGTPRLQKLLENDLTPEANSEHAAQ